MIWTKLPIHVIDFEGSKHSGIVEYGVVTLFEGKITHTHTRLCRALEEIFPEETRLHGIRKLDTESALPFGHEWKLFTELRKTGPLVAHNAHTENNLIKSVWPYPPKSPDWIHHDRIIASWGPWIDTYQLFKFIFPGLESYQLMDLIEAFDLTKKLEQVSAKYCDSHRKRPHCALYDALATALLMLKLGSLDGFEDMSAAWLLLKSASNIQDYQNLEQLRFRFA